MIATKEQHIHKFDKPKQTKVMLHKYDKQEFIVTTGFDVLKQRVCECGKVETYDLERTKA